MSKYYQMGSFIKEIQEKFLNYNIFCEKDRKFLDKEDYEEIFGNYHFMKSDNVLKKKLYNFFNFSNEEKKEMRIERKKKILKKRKRE